MGKEKKKRRLDGKPVDPSKGVEPGFCYSMGLFGSIAVGLQGTMAAYLLKHLKPLSQPAIRPLAFFILIKSFIPCLLTPVELFRISLSLISSLPL